MCSGAINMILPPGVADATSGRQAGLFPPAFGPAADARAAVDES